LLLITPLRAAGAPSPATGLAEGDFEALGAELLADGAGVGAGPKLVPGFFIFSLPQITSGDGLYLVLIV
jgi:hypothetical protein